jgi:hypothetical protein
VIKDKQGNPIKQGIIDVTLSPYGQIVGGSVTDNVGRFELYLNPKEKYQLKLKGYSFATTDKLKEESVTVEFEARNELDLSLVVMG